ncbi:MAG TPA: tyrosine-type recombinase/integrase [Bryobacteraceae bacterium]|nr:tyrosine-type recombinase/integrase [Bryobacteraceae bacterium]
MVFKRERSPFYYYRFMRNGVPVYVNTKQKNKETAQDMENAHRTRLAKGEAGLHTGAPTLKQFEKRFIDFVETRNAAKPRTIQFYKTTYANLLAFPALAGQRLERIDESLIEKYIQHRSGLLLGRVDEDGKLSIATVNRDVATLRRALRMAQEWKLIARVPKVRLLSGEPTRDYVLERSGEAAYLEACPQPLKDAALLILDTGLRLGEALALTWSDVSLEPTPGKKFGYAQIRQGKTKNARRAVSLTPRVVTMLTQRKADAVSHLVFPGESLEAPFLPSSLAHQHSRVRDKLKLSAGFVVHSLRHTALTRLGEAGADAFTIMRIAGHSSITISQRYVHPSNDAMELAFERLELGMVGAQAKSHQDAIAANA